MSSSNMRIKYSSSTTRTRGAADEEFVIGLSRHTTQSRAQSSILAQIPANMLITAAKEPERVESTAQPAGRRPHGVPADAASAWHCRPGGAAGDGRGAARA